MLCLDGVDQQGPGTLIYKELTLNTGISRPVLHLQVFGWGTEELTAGPLMLGPSCILPDHTTAEVTMVTLTGWVV